MVCGAIPVGPSGVAASVYDVARNAGWRTIGIVFSLQPPSFPAVAGASRRRICARSDEQIPAGFLICRPETVQVRPLAGAAPARLYDDASRSCGPGSGGAHFAPIPAPADWSVEKTDMPAESRRKIGEEQPCVSASLLSTTVTTASIWSSGMGASGGGASRWVEPIKDKVLPLIDSAANSYGANTGWPKRTEACDKSS